MFLYSCSVCTKKANRHFIVPAKDFKLIQVYMTVCGCNSASSAHAPDCDSVYVLSMSLGVVRLDIAVYWC